MKKSHISHLKKMLSEVNDFLKGNPTHPLALKDAKALSQSIKQKKLTPHAKDILAESIYQIEDNALFAVTSRDRLDIMRDILNSKGQTTFEFTVVLTGASILLGFMGIIYGVVQLAQ